MSRKKEQLHACANTNKNTHKKNTRVLGPSMREPTEPNIKKQARSDKHATLLQVYSIE